MPWSPEDAEKHIKGLSDEQKRAWASIANSALKQYGDEGRAIRVANAKAKQVKKRMQTAYVEVFAKALDAGMEDERAHAVAWEFVTKHLGSSHDQKTHDPTKRGGSKGSSSSSSSGKSGRGSAGDTGGGIFGSGRDQGRGENFKGQKAAGSRKVKQGKGFLRIDSPTSRDIRAANEFIGGQQAFNSGAIEVTRSGPRTTTVRNSATGKTVDFKLTRDGEVAAVRMRSKGRSHLREVKRTAGGLAGAVALPAAAALGGIAAASKFGKSEDGEFTTTVEFSKLDDDKRQVFGWAIVAKDAEGNDVIDRQGDVVSPEDVEKSAYDYVLHSRDGGEMHIKKGVSKLVESFVVTPEKLEAMGIVTKSSKGPGVPIGWWVGFTVEDERVWKRVKDGTYTAFSIHGFGKRQPIGKLSGDHIIKRLNEELHLAVARGDHESVEDIAKALRRVA